MPSSRLPRLLTALLVLFASGSDALAQCASTDPLPTLTEPQVSGFGPTSGAKVVSKTSVSRLHRVHESEGRVFYQFSDDGITWSTREEVTTLPGELSSPTIALPRQLVAVAFLHEPDAGGNGDLYFVTRTPDGVWSTPLLLDGVPAREPSMQSAEGDVHLVWANGQSVWYLTFDANAPPVSPLKEEVGATLVCSSGKATFPSIALVREDPCEKRPVKVFVAAGHTHDCTACGIPDPLTIRVDVLERTTDPLLYWAPRYTETTIVQFSNVGTASVSLASNRIRGTLVLAYSQFTAFEEFSRLVLLQPDGFTQVLDLGADRRLLDVEVRDSTCGGGVFLRLASTVPDGTGAGPTTVSTGVWNVGEPAPAWSSEELVASSARDPQAVLWARPLGKGRFFSVRSSFTVPIAPWEALVTDHLTCDGYPLKAEGLECAPWVPCATTMSSAGLKVSIF